MIHVPLTPSLSSDELAVALRYLPPTSLPAGAHDWPNLKEALRSAVRTFVSRARDASPDDLCRVGEGRGIVVPAGGAKLIPSAYALLRRLRDVGSTLPVEIWHLGDREMDPTIRRVFSELGARVVDAEVVRERHPFRILNGWELKVFAMLHSSFREVLLLDADNAPVATPDRVFEAEAYRKHGALFWPDFPVQRWTLSEDVWRTFGLEPPPAELGGRALVPNDRCEECYGQLLPSGYDAPIESGQLVVDKERCGLHLRLAGLLCEYSDVTFRYFYGDKETFRIAWRLLGDAFGLVGRVPGWSTHTYLQHDPTSPDASAVLFLHRVQDKLTLGAADNHRVEGLPGEDELLGYARDLAKLWGGKLWARPSRPTELEASVRDDLGERLGLYLAEGSPDRLIRLASDGTIDRGAGPDLRRWSVHEDAGGVVVLALEGDAGLSTTATLDPGGLLRDLSRSGAARLSAEAVFRGRRLSGDRGSFEIRPAALRLGSKGAPVPIDDPSLALRRDVDPAIRRRASDNLVYHARSLADLASAPVDVRGLAVDPSFVASGVWAPMNPSIARDPSRDGYRATVRLVNYAIGDYQGRTDGGAIRSRVLLVDLDRDLRAVACREVADLTGEGMSGAKVRGLEDCRLFHWRGGWWASATVVDRNAQRRAEIALAAFDDRGDAFAVVVQRFEPQYHQKNWVPVVSGDDLRFVYRADPTMILESDRGLRVRHVATHTPIPSLIDLRGSSQALPLPDRLGGYLYVAHQCHQRDGVRYYTHRFVRLDAALRIVALSDAFYLTKLSVEFVAGMARTDDGRLVLSFGIEDALAALAIVDEEAVLATLIDVADVVRNPRIPPFPRTELAAVSKG